MRPTAVILALWRMIRTRIDATWLVALDKELPYLFAVDHGGAGMDEYLRGCYAAPPPRARRHCRSAATTA
ncbi:hypothetical protein D3C71_875400 [compost metagenome]|jgi:hypothetical protein